MQTNTYLGLILLMSCTWNTPQFAVCLLRLTSVAALQVLHCHPIAAELSKSAGIRLESSEHGDIPATLCFPADSSAKSTIITRKPRRDMPDNM